jgi:hypothetical protein
MAQIQTGLNLHSAPVAWCAAGPKYNPTLTAQMPYSASGLLPHGRFLPFTGRFLP